MTSGETCKLTKHQKKINKELNKEYKQYVKKGYKIISVQDFEKKLIVFANNPKENHFLNGYVIVDKLSRYTSRTFLIENVAIYDCIFVDFKNIRHMVFEDTLLESCKFINCDFDGFGMYDTVLHGVSFMDCKFAYLKLRGCTTDHRELRFSNADIESMLVYGSVIQSLYFKGEIKEKIRVFSSCFSITEGITIVPFGSKMGTFQGTYYFIPEFNQVSAGCWTGTLDQFLDKGLLQNKSDTFRYESVKVAYLFFKQYLDKESRFQDILQLVKEVEKKRKERHNG